MSVTPQHIQDILAKDSLDNIDVGSIIKHFGIGIAVQDYIDPEKLEDKILSFKLKLLKVVVDEIDAHIGHDYL